MDKVNFISTADFDNIPKRATEFSAGYDLYATHYYELGPLKRVLMPLQLRMEIPPQYCGLILPRSGLAAKYGVTVLNSPGLVDSDYRGEWSVLLYNSSDSIAIIEKGDRIAQLVFVSYGNVSFQQVETLRETTRGTGGFGSTGR